MLAGRALKPSLVRVMSSWDVAVVAPEFSVSVWELEPSVLFSAWWVLSVVVIYTACVVKVTLRCSARKASSVSTQSQVTYRRDYAQPRFQPLGQGAHGAWRYEDPEGRA